MTSTYIHVTVPSSRADLLVADHDPPHLLDHAGHPLELDETGRNALEHVVRLLPGYYAPTKIVVEFLAALLLLLLALPLLAVVAAAIKLTSPGPVLFKQIRMGRDARPFVCYKFRTMVRDAEAIISRDHQLRESFVHSWKIDGDARITPVGKLLRKLSVDELPQFWNILRGEMSLIGPRPVQLAELEQHYGEIAPVVYCVRPGITGLWQVSGRSSVSYAERIQLDLDYVRRRGLRLDLSIALRTLPVVLFGKHAK